MKLKGKSKSDLTMKKAKERHLRDEFTYLFNTTLILGALYGMYGTTLKSTFIGIGLMVSSWKVLKKYA